VKPLTVAAALLVAIATAGAAQPSRDRAFWVAIVQNKYAVPPGEDAFALLVEMNALLASPDPVLRDDVAYGAAARWIQRKMLSPEQLKTLLTLWTGNLGAGLGESGTDAVFRRSFSALNLSILAAWDLQAPFLSEAEFASFLDRTLDYFARERDTRGYDVQKGWMHTPAHTADVLKFLARNPKLPRDAQARILRAIDHKTGAVGHVFTWGEDERLGQVVRSIVRRQDLEGPQFDAWLGVADALRKSVWVKAPAIQPETFMHAQNLTNVLRAAHVALSADADLSRDAQAARERLLKVIAR
jgi:hypothetical protein